MGQPVIKCLQGDYLWQAPAATAGDGVCVRQNSGISWGYMSTFRALVGRIMGRMDAKELQRCLNGVHNAIYPKDLKKQNKKLRLSQ